MTYYLLYFWAKPCPHNPLYEKHFLALPPLIGALPKASEPIESIYEPSIDTEAIVTFLRETQSKIAEHLGIDKKDKRLDKVLKEDGRFMLDGKSYALVGDTEVASLDNESFGSKTLVSRTFGLNYHSS